MKNTNTKHDCEQVDFTKSNLTQLPPTSPKPHLSALKTRFPIASSPVNFLVIRIGSQFNFSDRYVLKVVPAGTGSVPWLNLKITILTYYTKGSGRELGGGGNT